LSIRKAAWLGTLIAVDGGLLVLAAVIYILGRRSGVRQSEDQLLAPPVGDKAPV